MQVFGFELFSRIAAVLIAIAFLALPASSEPICDPHLDHSCIAAHLDEHVQADRPDSDRSAHEHETHSHGICHTQLLAPDSHAWTYQLSADVSFWLLPDDAMADCSASRLERPPRV